MGLHSFFPTRVSSGLNSGIKWRLRGRAFDYSSTLRASDSYEQPGGRPPLLLAAGDYELVIDGSAANVGPYAFRLLDVAASATPVAGNGVSVTGTLTPASETHAYAPYPAAGEDFETGRRGWRERLGT